ncbi:hypothetical protein NQ314_014903 [Rhamnusium bicolor]|uniref:Uncharacterized protein n=1 Tax=Rhamnusium bicolor TaxID=1586634 RepID=A0AAV8X0Q7_9CUCU|nr:hypothetical protein NQ314_014903 [Rhamnusium bicolor]
MTYTSHIMAFFELICIASKIKKLKENLAEEKTDAIKISKKQKTRKRFGHVGVKIQVAVRKVIKKILNCCCLEKFCYRVRHDGSCENYMLKSIFGFISGFILTYIFFTFFVFQLNFKFTTATIMCSILGCILTIGLAFSSTVR